MASATMCPRTQSRLVVGEAFLHPGCLLALALWWLNDDVLKWRFHNWITGKLSDICCMVVFPVLLLSLIQWGHALRGVEWRPGRGHVVLTLVGVGALFASVNLSFAVGHVYQVVFAHVLYPFLIVLEHAAAPPTIRHTVDPTDLLTLPMLFLTYQLIPRR